MTRMPRVTGKKVVSALKRSGYTVVRITGSPTTFINKEATWLLCQFTLERF